MAKKKKEEKTSKRNSVLTEEQEKQLEEMVNNMLGIASNVVDEYKDLDLSSLSELSQSLGSIVQVNESSPFLDEVFKGDAWKKVVKNIPSIQKDPKEDKEDDTE